MDNDRIVWIDAVRTGACALVVLVHINFYTRPPLASWWPGGFFSVPFFSLAVPLFVIVSGLFADRFATAARGRLLRLAWPFLTWNAITAVVLQAAGYRYGGAELLGDLLTGTWHLYYVFALLQLLAIHFLIVRFVRRDHHPTFFVVLAISTVALYALCDALLWKSGGRFTGVEEGAEKLFVCWALYFYAGVWLSRQSGTVKTARIVILAIVAAFGYIAYYIELRVEDATFGYAPLKQLLATGLVFQIAGALLVIDLLRRLGQTGSRVLAILAKPGRDTFGIYLCHNAILVPVFAALVNTGLATGDGYEAPLLFVLVWTIAHAAVAASRHFAPARIDALLFGGRGRAVRAPGR